MTFKEYFKNTPLLQSLVISFLFTSIFYYFFSPGFMTYDSLHAYRGAVNGISDSIWPPMVSYVWRAVLFFNGSDSSMFVFQVFLLFFSVAFCSILISKNFLVGFLVAMTFIIIPVLFGTTASVWKDVLTCALFFSALGMILKVKNLDKKFFLNFLIFLLIVLGSSVRHNAITAFAPLCFYLIYINLDHRLKLSKRIRNTLVYGFLLTFTIFGVKVCFDHFSIPELKPIKNNISFITRTQILDISGTSVCSGNNLFAAQFPSMDLSFVQENYDPRHINFSVKIIGSIEAEENYARRVSKIWISSFFTHPGCFFYNKAKLFQHLMGFHFGEQFLIVTPEIYDNEFGFYLPESNLRNYFVKYIIKGSSIFLFKPWFLLTLSLFLFLICYKKKLIKTEYVVLTASSIFYLLGLVLFGNAADARLPFLTNTISSILIILLLNSFFKEKN